MKFVLVQLADFKSYSVGLDAGALARRSPGGRMCRSSQRTLWRCR